MKNKILDNITNSICIVNKKSEIIFSNKSFEKTFGNVDSLYDLVDESYKERIKDCINNNYNIILKSKPKNRIIKNNNNFYDINIKPIEDELFLIEIFEKNQDIIRRDFMEDSINRITKLNNIRKNILELLDEALIKKENPFIFIEKIIKILYDNGLFDFVEIKSNNKIVFYGDKNVLEDYSFLKPYNPVEFYSYTGKEEKIELLYFINNASSVDLKSMLHSSIKFMKLYTDAYNEFSKNRDYENQMLDNEKFNLAGQMLVGMFHEINNPLAIGIMQAEMILKYNKKDYIDRVEKIKESLQRIKNITEVFKGSLRSQKEEKPFNIYECILNAIDYVDKRNDGKVDIEIKKEKEEYIFIGDYPKLLLVFVNLLSNSIDAIKEKKKTDGKIFIHIFDYNKNIIIKMSDNGIGMDKEIAKNVFKPFYTTKSKTGLGYGMFFVSSVCAVHNIKISLVSKKSIGTTFTLVLSKEREEK